MKKINLKHWFYQVRFNLKYFLIHNLGSIVLFVTIILAGLGLLYLGSIVAYFAPYQAPVTLTPTATLVPTATPYPYKENEFSKIANEICGKTYPWFLHSGMFTISDSYFWNEDSDTGKAVFTYYPNGTITIDGKTYDYSYGVDSFKVSSQNKAVSTDEMTRVYNALKEMTKVPLQVTFNVRLVAEDSYGYTVPSCLPLDQ